jgi:hypothetical protein
MIKTGLAIIGGLVAILVAIPVSQVVWAKLT